MRAGVATAVRPIKSPSISSDMGIEARRFVMQSLRVCLCRDPVPAASPVRDDPTFFGRGFCCICAFCHGFRDMMPWYAPVPISKGCARHLLPRCYGGPCRRGPGGDMHQGCLSRSNGDEACICGGHFMHWGYHPVPRSVEKARPCVPLEVALSGAGIASRFLPLIVLVGGPAGWQYPHLGCPIGTHWAWTM